MPSTRSSTPPAPWPTAPITAPTGRRPPPASRTTSGRSSPIPTGTGSTAAHSGPIPGPHGPGNGPAGGSPDLTEDREFRRLQALYRSGLLDTGAEARFDRLTARTREWFDVSSSSIALIAEDRQVIKSLAGPIGQDLPLELSLCAVTVTADRTLVIPDALQHPSYRDHPLVTVGPKVRLYAGHPLTSVDGWRIGSLCVMDDKPRDFTENDVRDLRSFAQLVQEEIWRGPLG